MQARGYKASTTIDFEDSFNAAPKTKGGFILPINKNEMEKKQTLITSDTISGTRNDTQSSLGRVSTDGTITVPADYRAMGFWLKAQFGNPVSTPATPATGDAAAGPYTHKFTVGDFQPSLIIEKAFPDASKYMRYHGCKVNTAKWAFGEDQEMVVELDMMGAERELADAAYNAAAVPIMKKPISQNHTYVKIGGTESRIIKTGDFTLDAGLDGDQYVVGGGGIRGDIPEGLMKASGNLEALFMDTSMMALADSGEKTSMEIGFKMNDNFSLAFIFPEVQIEPHDAPIDGPAGVSVKFAWKAFYESDAAKSLVQVTLVNDRESY